MDPDASAMLAHVVTLRGDIPRLLQHLPQAVFETFNRHPRMRASILPGSVPQKAMICSALTSVSDLASLLTIHDCTVDKEEHTEQENSKNHAVTFTLPQSKWMEFVRDECEKPLNREKCFPFYLVAHVDMSTNAFARLCLFSDHYMSDTTSGFIILRDILQMITTSTKLPKELPLRKSLYEKTHFVNAWMNVIHEAVSKYVIQPLMSFDTSAFAPLLALQTGSQLDFAGLPPSPPNPSFALFARGSEANMLSAVRRCKEHNVSLQGAIIAATLMAFGLVKYNGKLGDCSKSLHLRMDVMNDMRQQMTSDSVKPGLFDSISAQTTGEVPIGLYSTPAHLIFTSSEGIDVHGMSFWDVALKADHEWECAVVGHELKMQSIYVNEVLNAESRTTSELFVANCALSDVTLEFLDCSDANSWPFNDDKSLQVENMHVYSSRPSLSSTSNLSITALSHFNYALMFKLEPNVAHQLFKWIVWCTERIGQYREKDTLAQSADWLASEVELAILDDPSRLT
ncbi:uncharacterized protein PHALS_04064 [Plasmopara halstedii]|uniref:Condensation domain-containing protein n=1 Tax=Plasmopara halstedii TaxID=4781 RepID=A0A0P1A9E2_PLAHL|nr:uncharacterized protein PHALS_04064 [Plasmopara halstedii]CEG36807.1 hypothetical protein PHALS_04064 [Plasmopara halstedii]|eukprot:XP_024573176.1 hypothetical protein PHALS_04064 [Plasmopara halstedii]